MATSSVTTNCNEDLEADLVSVIENPDLTKGELELASKFTDILLQREKYIEEMNKKAADLRNDQEYLRKSYNELQGKVKIGEDEFKKLSGKIRVLEGTNLELETANKKFETDLNESKNTVDYLKKERDKLQNSINEKNGVIADLVNKSSNIFEKEKKLSEEIEKIRLENEALKPMIADLKKKRSNSDDEDLTDLVMLTAEKLLKNSSSSVINWTLRNPKKAVLSMYGFYALGPISMISLMGIIATVNATLKRLTPADR